jgi:hypothetical protein
MDDDDDRAIEIPLDSPGIFVLGAADQGAFHGMLGVDVRIMARIAWHPSECERPLERELTITLRTAMRDDFITLHLGEAAAKSLRDLLAEFFDRSPSLELWKARN